MTTAPAIEADRLRKVYRTKHGEHAAVCDLSFRLEAGASIGIVGGSGAGKTTVASLLMGFVRPSSGSVKINGVDRPATLSGAERKSWARRIQVVFQDPYSSLDPHQRLGSVIDEVLRHHFGSMSRHERSGRTAELLESVGLSPALVRSFPGSLSGGQLQRVAIARALALRPQILLLDEAVAALDVSIQAQILNLLNDLRSELGLTYVVISHDLGVIRYTTDQVIVMRRGELVEAGSTAAVLDSPASEYTRALIAAAPERARAGRGALLTD